jgi:phosphate uptake regulator
MRERFERELKVLAEEILKMGLMVERALGKAMNALKSADTDAADSIVAADRDIDEMEAKIEGLCAMIIAREQPVAGDLRDVLTAQKSLRSWNAWGTMPGVWRKEPASSVSENWPLPCRFLILCWIAFSR